MNLKSNRRKTEAVKDLSQLPHVPDEGLKLAQDELAMHQQQIREGLEDIAKGNVYSTEQVLEYLKSSGH